jgi:hypothetical protein
MRNEHEPAENVLAMERDQEQKECLCGMGARSFGKRLGRPEH